MPIGSVVQSLLRRFNLDLSRVTTEKRLLRDAAFTQTALLRHRNISTIFDVGANVGQTARLYSRLFPNATIYCFEPFDEAFNQLARSCVSLKNVRPFKLALADRKGTRQFYVNRDNRTNSLFPIAAGQPAAGHLSPAGVIDVATDTIDGFCREIGIEHIDILKMDIQGAELMALQGAENMLVRRAISLVYTEVCFVRMYESQAQFSDIVAAMRGRQYELFGLYDLSRLAGQGVSWGDAIFTSPAVLQDAGPDLI